MNYNLYYKLLMCSEDYTCKHLCYAKLLFLCFNAEKLHVHFAALFSGAHPAFLLAHFQTLVHCIFIFL